MRPRKRRKSWRVKIERPEEIYRRPEIFYTKKEAERYAKSSAMKKAQTEITDRALEFISIPKGRILDVGCGAGFSMELLKDRGYKVVGIDVSDEMLKKAKEKKLNVLKSDMRSLPFKEKSFDGIVSVSSLQWLLTGEDRAKIRDNIKKTAKEAKRVLKTKRKAVFQFYPQSEEMMRLVGKTFAKEGLKGYFAIDNPDNPRKRRIFLVVQKTA